MPKKNVAHLSSVHTRFDTRIFLKECRSLAAAGYQVSLVVADGKGDEYIEGVRIYDVGTTPGRLRRMTTTSRRIMTRALELDADIYHLHDPELLMIAGRLRRAGKTVIFDAHEDVPVQLLGKLYIHPWIKRWLSKLYAAYETRVCRGLNAVVAATPFIRGRFLRINSNTVNINNYPIPEELASPEVDRGGERHQVCYIGGIGESRGIREVVDAMDLLECDARLALCGRFEDESIRSRVESLAGWKKVEDMGWLGRNDIRQVLLESAAGLVTLHPQQHFLDSHPIKMFEYMSAAIPVIASDFPLWREIVEGNDCGICVNPQDPHAIAKAIDFMVENRFRAREMGENGREAVRNFYNWPAEERKLLTLYERLSHEIHA
jgi:glycosyltransferase involved in cell wall biosynthesis